MSLPEQLKVKFRCKRSGNFVSFSNPNDIEGLRKHEGYEEVKELIVEAQPEVEQPPVKKLGRPKKK
jgi:hypothetical protein